MNVWLYPTDLHRIDLIKQRAEQRAIKQQLDQSKAETAQAIQPNTKFLSTVAADFTGEGRLQFQNGDIYEGNFVMGKMEGEGILRTLGGDVYAGSFKNGFKHGKGKIIYGSGNNRGGSYEGDWAYNKKEGRGTCIDSNGDRYDGAFMGNSCHGDGTQIYASNGARYVGMW